MFYFGQVPFNPKTVKNLTYFQKKWKGSIIVGEHKWQFKTASLNFRFHRHLQLLSWRQDQYLRKSSSTEVAYLCMVAFLSESPFVSAGLLVWWLEFKLVAKYWLCGRSRILQVIKNFSKTCINIIVWKKIKRYKFVYVEPQLERKRVWGRKQFIFKFHTYQRQILSIYYNS